jgi:mRNA interferase YafQ
MLKPIYTRQFEKDLKRAVKRGNDITKLKSMIRLLINQEKIPQRNNDHKLLGRFQNRRECHIEPDWLLIYKIIEEKIIFERTGTHSDLFR